MLMAPPHSTTASYGSCGSSQTWENQAKTFGSPATTLFLIDWDDTVLSSSWLAAQGLRLDSTHIPEEVQKQLVVLQQWSCALLEKALTLGQVALVTNAERGWIELSARKFMPGIVPLLEKVRILSARTQFQDQFPNQTQMWKNAAYDLVFDEAFGSIRDHTANFDGKLNVLSFGDALYERNALMHLAERFQIVLAKSVKLIERPSVEQLQRELEILCSNLDVLVSSKDKVDLMLTVEYLDEC